MKVVVTAADDSSGYYRLVNPIAHLDDPSIETEIVTQRVGLPLEVNRLSGRFVGIDLDADVLVLQRPMFALMPDLIDYVQAKGIAVVIELDDDFHTAHPLNRAFQLNHPKTSPDYNWHHLAEAIKRADLITVSTEQLARRYGSHGRVVVLRNYVDRQLTQIKQRDRGALLGWAGTILNHPLDLRATQGGVAQALTKHPGWHMLVAGGAGSDDEIAKQLGIDQSQLETTPWKPRELHRLVVSQFSVGIAPLADTAFNAAKSWLKGVEYAALGIPFVASDLPEYELLSQHYGIGLTAPPKGRLWARALTRLMDAPNRSEIGQQWRQLVIDKLLIEDNAWQWAEAWHQAWLERKHRAIPQPRRQHA